MWIEHHTHPRLQQHNEECILHIPSIFFFLILMRFIRTPNTIPCHIVHRRPVQRIYNKIIASELRKSFFSLALSLNFRAVECRMWAVIRASGMNQCIYSWESRSGMTRSKENELQTNTWAMMVTRSAEQERERERFCHFRQNDLSELNDFNSAQSLLISAFHHSYVIRIPRLRCLAERNERMTDYSLVYGNSVGSPSSMHCCWYCDAMVALTFDACLHFTAMPQSTQLCVHR